MMFGLFSSLIFITGIFFFSCITPFSMMVVLVAEVFFVMLVISLLKVSMWFSYILMIVMLGGVLVLFAYSMSLIYELKVDTLMINKSVFSVLLMTFIFLVVKYNLHNVYGYFSDTMYEYNFIISSSANISMWSNLFMYMFVVLYLLISLLCVSNMLKLNNVPLRLM